MQRVRNADHAGGHLTGWGATQGKNSSHGIGRRLVLALPVVLATVTEALANEDTIDMSRAVFVVMAGSTVVPFIDPDTDRIAGTVDVGVVPHQVELASSISKLLVIDGKSAKVNVVDVVANEIRSIPLDLVPGRIAVSVDGLTAALADSGTGRVVLLDLLRRRSLGAIDGGAPVRDMVFSTDNRTLYVSRKDQDSIGAIEVAAARQEARIASGLPHGGLALSRSPNGRRLFVQPDGSAGVGVLDLERGRPLEPIEAGRASTVAFPSGTGAYLLIADNERATLTVIRDGTAATATLLKGATGVDTIYTAWFDTLALVPSTSAKAVLLYDLDALKPAGVVRLPAAPARGAVTPDGKKLYLPVPEAGKVVAIDARRRRLAASITVPGTPETVLLAGSYGICH